VPRVRRQQLKLQWRSEERRYQRALARDLNLARRRPTDPKLHDFGKLSLDLLVLGNGLAPQCIDPLAVAADFIR
jgi:hypothetical protein